MAEKYSWIPESGLAFFDEGGGEENIDLAAFQYDKEAAYGMLDRIVQGCRDQLSDLSTHEIRAILRFADMTLIGALRGRKLVDTDGTEIIPEAVNWKGANQLDFIHILIAILGENTILISDEDHPDIESWELSPVRLCAAFALRMAFNSSREYLSWDEARGLREYYLAQASVAFGLMQSLAMNREDGIPGAIKSARTVSTSRAAARKSWDDSPKAEAMAAIRKEWEAMRSSTKHVSDAEFARRAMERYGDVISNEGSIKNAISRWRKET